MSPVPTIPASAIIRAAEIRFLSPAGAVIRTARTVGHGRSAEFAPVGSRGSERDHKNDGGNKNNQNPMWHRITSEKFRTCVVGCRP